MWECAGANCQPIAGNCRAREAADLQLLEDVQLGSNNSPSPVCARCACLWVHVWSREVNLRHLPLSLHILLSDKGPYRIWNSLSQLGGLASAFQGPPVSFLPPSAGVTGTYCHTQFSHGCWGLELKPSGLCNNCTLPTELSHLNYCLVVLRCGLIL